MARTGGKYFEKAGLFNENLGRTEDNEMHYRILKAGYQICYTPSIISYQHTRNTWHGMIKQKYGNGYWVGLTLGMCPQCFSLYHFIPFCFVLSIFATSLLAIVKKPFFMFLLWGMYAAVNLIMSFASICKERKHWQYIMLPLIFLSLHVAYGWGTIVGIVKMPFWKKKLEKDS